jgi:hypothetical protein
MNLFRKIFGSTSDEDKNEEEGKFAPQINIPVDEKFTTNFKKNGGKFLYCEDLNEIREQFLNILEENDWFESEVLCYETKLFSLLDENKLVYKNVQNPKFFFTICEDLIADDGSILFSSKQFKHYKANEIPCDMVVFATTSQLVGNKSDGLRNIKKRYDKEYPSNITTIKYFEKTKEEDFLHYGSSHKNLYLLLLEDL